MPARSLHISSSFTYYTYLSAFDYAPATALLRKKRYEGSANSVLHRLNGWIDERYYLTVNYPNGGRRWSWYRWEHGLVQKKSGKDFGFTTFNTQMKPELR